MRFMMLMIPKGYAAAAPGTMPDPKHVAAMMKYNDELQKAGVLVALDGLHPPSMGARVSFSGGKAKVLNRPIHGGKAGTERPAASHLGVFSRPLAKKPKPN